MIDKTDGRRIEVRDILRAGAPSAAYAKVPEDSPQYRIGARWYVYYGTLGTIREGTHTVTEHDDGTITVEPSLVMPPFPGMKEHWHGWLRRGVFEGQFENVGEVNE